jgi:hypothetical protein
MSKSTDITYKDIELWKYGIKESAKLVKFKCDDAEKLRDSLSKRCADLAFFVQFAESLMVIDVDQDVYDKTLEYRRNLEKILEEE